MLIAASSLPRRKLASFVLHVPCPCPNQIHTLLHNLWNMFLNGLAQLSSSLSTSTGFMLGPIIPNARPSEHTELIHAKTVT